jgi:hypothetical protein
MAGGRPLQYREIRKKRLQLDAHRCVKCSGKDHLTVHHRVPRSEGGKDDLANLETLCAKCHLSVHRSERRARASRKVANRALRKSLRPHIREIRDELTRRVMEILAYFFQMLEELIRGEPAHGAKA